MDPPDAGSGMVCVTFSKKRGRGDASAGPSQGAHSPTNLTGIHHGCSKWNRVSTSRMGTPQQIERPRHLARNGARM
jgi:hypothetical protein